MKKSHIFGIIVIAIAISIVVSTAGDASQYVTFEEAGMMASNGDNAKVHVVGTLKKDAQGNILGMEYNPSVDPNYLGFVLVDQNQKEHKVVCYNPPPSMQDFTKSEQVVIIGRAKNEDNVFVANEILMKCPSKYEETEIKM